MDADHATTGRSRVAEAARLYASGMTAREVAAELGVHEATVRRWLTEQLRRTGPRGRTDVPTGRLAQLRDSGMTLAEIAEAVGMSKTGVRLRLEGRPSRRRRG